jgi:hypothetical protein
MLGLATMLLVATACCTQELPRDSRTPDTNAALLGKTDAKGLWQYLLDCAERHTPQCRAQVERVAARTSQIEAVGRLATVLLQEWELEPMHASLLKRGKYGYRFQTPRKFVTSYHRSLMRRSLS